MRRQRMSCGLVTHNRLMFFVRSCYLPAGTVHYVRNTASTETALLGLFDHPQASTQFVPNSLVAMPKDILASAFMGGALPSAVNAPIFKVNGCK